MMLKIAKWDTADVLTKPGRIAAYLDAVLEDGDPELLKLALDNIERSRTLRFNSAAERNGEG